MFVRTDVAVISFQDIEDRTPAFLSYMREVDDRLRRRRIPIHARPLHAMREIAVDNRITIILGGVLPAPHADRINEWFEQRYGVRLKVDFSPGRAVVLIRGDPYLLRLPLIIGKWDGIIDVTKTFDGMTQPMFAELPEASQADMVWAFSWFQARFQEMECLPPEIRANMDAAILQMMSQTPHYGESKWASLQLAEKALKAFITRRGSEPEKTHILERLLATAEALGLPKGRWPLLAMIQCPASVRYDHKVDLNDAVLAHHASIDLAAFVAQYMDPKSGSGGEVAESLIPDLVIGFSDCVETSHNGSLLFRFVMCDGTSRWVLIAASICIWLRDGIGKSLSAGRHPDERLEFENGRDLRGAPPRHPVRMFLANQPQMDKRDFDKPCEQVNHCKVIDSEGGMEFQLTMVDGIKRRLVMWSTVVNYFHLYLDEGIREAQAHGLFVENA